MKKLAVFVEGQTEQLFVERLLEEAAGKKQICIEKRQAFGGRPTVRRRGRGSWRAVWTTAGSLLRRDIEPIPRRNSL